MGIGGTHLAFELDFLFILVHVGYGRQHREGLGDSRCTERTTSLDGSCLWSKSVHMRLLWRHWMLCVGRCNALPVLDQNE